MIVRDLIDALKQFDDDMEVRIGMIQHYGSNFAIELSDDIEAHQIEGFYGEDFKAVVLTEGEQIGVVNYDDEEEE